MSRKPNAGPQEWTGTEDRAGLWSPFGRASRYCHLWQAFPCTHWALQAFTNAFPAPWGVHPVQTVSAGGAPVPAVPQTGCVFLDKSLDLSDPDLTI